MTDLLPPDNPAIKVSVKPGTAQTAAGERLAVEVECSPEIAAPVVHGLDAAIDGVAIEELPAATLDRRGWRRCTLRPTGSRWLPLRSKHPLDPSRMVLAMLRGTTDDERACVQLVFSPLGRRVRRQGSREVRRLRFGRRGGADAVIDFGLDLGREMVDAVSGGSSPRSTGSPPQQYRPGPWALKQAGAIEEKTAEPLLAVTIRLAVAGGTRTARRSRLQALAGTFAQFHALGGVHAGRELGGGGRFERALPARTPLALTAAEAAAMLPLPTSLSDARLVIAEAPARRLPPAADAPRFGVRLGGAER